MDDEVITNLGHPVAYVAIICLSMSISFCEKRLFMKIQKAINGTFQWCLVRLSSIDDLF